MFIENKYTKWYYNIIDKAKIRSVLRSYFEGEYHHIIPKSLGGNDESDNIVKLTYREHYICHLLLTKMLQDKNHTIKMCWALHRLTFTKTIFNSYQYELSRKIHIKNMKENHPSLKQEWKDKVSEIVYSHWENNDKRRRNTSEKMKENWNKNREKLIEHNKKIAKLGAQAAKEKVSKKIEYKGEYYTGWREFEEKTNITRHLYTKYYMNGIDPEFRVGTNGPIKREKESQ